MRTTRFLVALLFAGLPAMGRAQEATGDSVPAKPKNDGGAKKWEVRVGGFMVSGERAASLNRTVSSSTGSLKGVEAVLRAPAVGIMVRSLESSFGNPPDVINADASVILGPPAFSVFLGAGKRALTSTIGTNVFTFARVGLQMTFNIGSTGLRGQAGGWVTKAGPDDGDRMDQGMEGEASILYSPPRIPLFVQIGYRNEMFTSKTPTTTLPEEVRGLRIGAGLQLGGK
jgi:hypothetical protein